MAVVVSGEMVMYAKATDRTPRKLLRQIRLRLGELKRYHESLDYVGSNWYQIVRSECACAGAADWDPDNSQWLCWMECAFEKVGESARQAEAAGDLDTLERLLLLLY